MSEVIRQEVRMDRRPPARRPARLVGVLLLASSLSSCATPRAGGPGDFAPVPSVRTLEGSPPGGHPYRLHVPGGATPEHPARLVVWLHPSTASFNRQVEALVPALAARGFALVVVTDKDFEGWTREEVRQLVEGTLPIVSRTPGLDARRPVLLGFSAGGQLALLLWLQFPGVFSGAAILGAEPVAFGPGGASREIRPPSGEAARATPLWVLEGAREPGARMWRGVEEPWRAAGVPLELRIAAGRGHEWLLAEPPERDAFLAWIEKLASPSPR